MDDENIYVNAGGTSKQSQRNYRRCYHPNIVSSRDAESILLEKGRPGSFLLRPSKNTPGNYTLSIRRQDSCIIHVRIINEGDFYQIFGTQHENLAFASVNDLIEYYSNQPEVPLTQRGGQRLELIYPLNCADIIHERWFHGLMSSRDAEKLVNKKGNGYFLVRESNKRPGNYVISFCLNDQCSHLLVVYDPEKSQFVLGEKSYSSMNEIIAMMREQPYYMSGPHQGVAYLKYPLYTSAVFNAVGIGERLKQLEATGCTDDPNKSTEFGFVEEFQALQGMETKTYDQVIAKETHNKQRNRYKNILPYDYCRVILKDKDPSVPGSDYINASYITMEDDLVKHTTYIASQGCLSGTITDFWRMIWQENSRVIMMVTKEVELGKNKCARYWPNLNETANHDTPTGTLILKTVDERNMKDYVARQFLLSMEGQRAPPRTVSQLFCKSWPDHGVPTDPGVVHNILYEANLRQQSIVNAGPLVVHCSAGIGRTGTVIVTDILSHRIRQLGLECEIDIQKTLCNLRKQRPGMVQTADQYKFIYVAMTSYVETLLQRLEEGKKNKAEEGNLYANVICDGGEINVINENTISGCTKKKK